MFLLNGVDEVKGAKTNDPISVIWERTLSRILDLDLAYIIPSFILSVAESEARGDASKEAKS